MGTFNLQVKNLDAALRTIDVTVKNIQVAAQGELDAWAQDTATLAKQLAPVDEGHLRASINAYSGKLSASVTVAVYYAAYIEFGTRKFAAAYVNSLPQDWQEFAASYRGSAGGGSFKDFVMRITQWVKRKGFEAEVTKSGNRSKSKSSQAAEEQAAYMIALSILRNGLKPHPFLFPAYAKTTPELKKRLKELVK